MWLSVDSTIGHGSYYRRKDGWGAERSGQCVALRSDGDRCNRLLDEGEGFCDFHYSRLLDWVADQHAERVIRRARRLNPTVMRYIIDASRLDDAMRVLEDAEAEVYFIACGDIVKIGFSRNVLGRFHSLRISAGKTLIPEGYDWRDIELLGSAVGGRAVEARLHGLLRTYRLAGEWFRLTPTVIQAIDFMLYEADPPKAIEAGLRDIHAYDDFKGGHNRRRNRGAA